MNAQNLRNRLQDGDNTLTPIEICIAYAYKLAPIFAERALEDVADLENKIEALQEERGDLLVIVEAINKAIAPFVRIPFDSPDPHPVTPEEMRGQGL